MKAKKLTKETISQIGITEVNYPEFKAGDTIAVAQKIKEGDKERIQVFQGDVIAINNNHASSTFTVRKIGANSVAVERIFPYFSPLIESIKVIKKAKVRRAKLYYVREKVGKAARLREEILTKEQKEQLAQVNEAGVAKAQIDEASL